jgi:hypothetical protein
VIVVVGSRHDPVATSLVAAWPGAALCAAGDLTTEGWVWPVGAGRRTWVVGGERVPDERVTGVFVRRATVYPEELTGVHRDDRAYLGAEAHAFLVHVLGTTSATVANPVADGALGDELVRPERWMPLAAAAGLAVAPVRLTTLPRRPRPRTTRLAEVVGDEVVGDVSARAGAAAARLAGALGLRWAGVVLDGRSRVLTVTTQHPPSDAARDLLGRLLGAAA